MSEKKFKIRDKVDEAFTLIYKAPMEYYLRACNYATSMSTLLFGGFLIKMWIERNDPVDTEDKPFDLLNGKVLIAESDYKYFAIGLVGFNLVLRIFLYRYPLRIYKRGSK